MKKILNLISFLLIFCWNSKLFAADKTLDVVKERGNLVCGVSQGLAGFSYPDSDGNWSGMDVDYCRAIASAIFDDPNKVEFVPLSAKERFVALQAKEIDVLSRNTTWTFSRDTGLGLDFIGTIYYDGQGFMIPKKLDLESVKNLDGAVICTNTGTTTELNIADYFREHNLKYEILSFEKSDETVAAYESGRCDAYSTDRSGLVAQKMRLSNPDAHMIMQDLISKEPLSPVVRQGDDEWANILRWVLFVMINAEEIGVSKDNLKNLKLSNKSPTALRLLGKQDDIGTAINLSKDWAFNVIKHVGNYNDIFQKNLGEQSDINIDRGLNRLWKDGGILFAPPLR